MTRLVLVAIVSFAIPAAAGGKPPPPPSKATLASCAKERDLRKRAYCLYGIEDARAIDPLMAIAQQIADAKPDFPNYAQDDFYYAAENAGVVAAKTSDDRLHALLDKSDEFTQLFALRALGHMLSILRMGYAKGAPIDTPRRAERLAKVSQHCGAFLDRPSERLVREAVRCVAETHDTAHNDALVAVVTSARSGDLRSYVAEVSREFRLTPAQIDALLPVLSTPVGDNWLVGDLEVKDVVCQIGSAQASDKWRSGAAQAIAIAGDRRQLDHCKKLAGANTPTKKLTIAGDVPEAVRGPSEKCRYQKIGTQNTEVCAVQSASGAVVEFRDPAKLDTPKKPQTAKHALLGKLDVSLRQGEQLAVQLVAVHELTNGKYIVAVPSRSADDGHLSLYIVDTNFRPKLAWQSPACGAGCGGQSVQLRFKPGAPDKTLLIVQSNHDTQKTIATLTWNGSALK